MLSHRLPDDRQPNPWARLLRARRVAGASLLDLANSNPTAVGLAAAIEPALAALADPLAARYQPDPLGLRPAREAVVGYYAARDVAMDPDQIVLTASASESYAHLFRLLGDHGDVFLVPSPSYPLFEPLAAIEGVRLEPYRLSYDGRWHLDTGSFAEAIGRGRVRGVIVVEPNNPTGSCLAPEELATIEAHCQRVGAAMISDEVFSDFPWPPRTDPLPSMLGERRVPTFVLGGLSKSCGLPQLKLGWIAVAGPQAARDEVLAGLEWIADLFLSVGTPVQLALPRLLEFRHAFQDQVHERIRSNLEALAAFTQRRPEVDRLAAHGGWSAVLRLPQRRTGEQWALELLQRDVIVHPGEFYDMDWAAHVVVSLIVEPAILSGGLRMVESLLAES